MTQPTDNQVPPRLDTPLLTPTEAAQLLAVKPSWIYEAVRAGTLPCEGVRGRPIFCVGGSCLTVTVYSSCCEE